MIRVDFRCENCRLLQFDVNVMEDANVTCPHCEHTVDVGVYLGPGGWEELQAEYAAKVHQDDRTDAEVKDILNEESAAR